MPTVFDRRMVARGKLMSKRLLTIVIFIITTGAIGCQSQIVQQIVDWGADYL